jgi:hypothetical protein
MALTKQAYELVKKKTHIFPGDWKATGQSFYNW